MISSSQFNYTPIRLACIGGSIDSAVGRAHQVALSMDLKFKVVSGIFSRNKDLNIKSAVSYGISPDRAYEDIDTLLEKEIDSIDAVLIITPTDQHAEQVRKCIEKKVFVICEKALATSSEEISRLAMLSKEYQSGVAVVYNYLGYPMLRELKNIIQAGKLGQIQQIHIEMPQDGFARLKQDNTPNVPQSWRLKDFPKVSAVSLDLGTHVHSIIKFLTDLSPEKLIAKCESLGNFSEIIDNVNCIALYDNGLSCNIWYGKVALGYRNGLKVRVFGDIGAAEWIQEFPEQILITDVYGSKRTIDRGNNDVKIASQSRYTRFKVGHPTGFIEALANFYWDVYETFQDAKKTNRPYNGGIYSIEAALEGLKMMEAIDRSSRSEKWERI